MSSKFSRTRLRRQTTPDVCISLPPEPSPQFPPIPSTRAWVHVRIRWWNFDVFYEDEYTAYDDGGTPPLVFGWNTSMANPVRNCQLLLTDDGITPAAANGNWGPDNLAVLAWDCTLPPGNLNDYYDSGFVTIYDTSNSEPAGQARFTTAGEIFTP